MNTANSSLERVLFWALLALIVWVPLPYASVLPWCRAVIEVWIFFLMMLWLFEYIKGQVRFTPVFVKSMPVITLLMVWLFWIGMQFVSLPSELVAVISPHSARINALAGNAAWISTSVNPHATASLWLESASLVMFFALLLLLVNNNSRLKLLAQTLVYSGLFQAVYGSLMTLSGLEFIFFSRKWDYIGSATGTFVNRNHLAGYLGMCLAVGIGLLISKLGGHHADDWLQRLRNFILFVFSSKLRLRVYLALMVIALVLTRSRTGNTAFFSSLLAAGTVRLVFSRHESISLVMLLVSLVIIDTFIVGEWFGIEKVIERIASSSVDQDASRIDLTEKGIRQWLDYPLTGSGLGSFDTVFTRYKNMELNGFPEHAHNDYVEFGSETGIVGFCLLGLFVMTSFLAALTALRRRHDPLMRGMAFSAVMGIIAIMVHSTVDFNLQIPSNALTFMVILALGWLSLHLDSGHRHKSRGG